MAKKTRLTALGAAAAMVALSPLALKSAHAVNAVGNAKGTILATHLAITAAQSLNFGALLAAGAPGTVKIDAAGGRTTTVVTALSTPAPSKAIMNIFGTSAVNVVISVTKPTFLVSAGTKTMSVKQFEINTNAGGSKQTLNMTGITMPVPIGATLHVGAGQAVGSYAGTFTVNVHY